MSRIFNKLVWSSDKDHHVHAHVEVYPRPSIPVKREVVVFVYNELVEVSPSMAREIAAAMLKAADIADAVNVETLR